MLCLKCDRKQRRKCERLATCNPNISKRSPNGFNKRTIGARALTPPPSPATRAESNARARVAGRIINRLGRRKWAGPLSRRDSGLLAMAEGQQQLLDAINNTTAPLAPISGAILAATALLLRAPLSPPPAPRAHSLCATRLRAAQKT